MMTISLKIEIIKVFKLEFELSSDNNKKKKEEKDDKTSDDATATTKSK